VLNSTPIDHGYDTLLWTRSILAELLNKHFGIGVSEATVGLHLHQLDLSCQNPVIGLGSGSGESGCIFGG